VLEEIPGWQPIVDAAWQDIAVRNVGEMIRRDWNHPSSVLWGVRINESHDNHAFYTRTNALAHSLADAGPTGGIRYLYDSGTVPILSNCDHLKIYYAGQLKQELDPDHAAFGNLKYPPFMMNLGNLPLNPWGDLKIEGYIKGRLAKTLTLPAREKIRT
jgi:hypothetical protein